MKEKKKSRLRADRVFLAMAAIVGTLFGADGLRRSLTGNQPNNIKIDGEFRSSEEIVETPTGNSLAYNTADQATTAFEGIRNLGYTERELSRDMLSTGLLSVYTDDSPANEYDQDDMVSLSDEKNEFYSLSDDDIYLNDDAADALNRMMEDYANETALSDFIVYGTTNTYTGGDSFCPLDFTESKAGYCVDLALNAYGSVMAYDGYDTEGWVVDNCWKYGFIVRCPEGKAEKTGVEYCPWHLRYVGEINSAIMEQKNMCLEEYVDFLEQYSFDDPYTFAFNGNGYQIYSVAGEEDKLVARVPLSGNYEFSGDNRGAFIITVHKN